MRRGGSGDNRGVADSKTAISTRLIHPRAAGHRMGASPPIDRSSTYRLDVAAEEALATRIGHGEHDIYGRFGTATTRETADMVAELEGAEAGVLFASGMAAIWSALGDLVPSGGAVAVSDDVYGGTEHLLDGELVERGVDVRRFDAADVASFDRLTADGFKPDVVYCESISNPLLSVADISGLAERTKATHALIVVDATFAAGVAQRPLERGADVVLHSATKFLNGHSDVIAGVACGASQIVTRLHASMARVGSNIDPQAAWLLARGLRTLPLRFDRQCSTASALADRLADARGVEAVLYPGRADHPTHAVAKRELNGCFGGVVSFEMKSGDAARSFVERLQLCSSAVSLGGVETLVTIPRRSSHVGDATDWDARGISAGLVRVSLGLEDIEDIWADVSQALDRATD